MSTQSSSFSSGHGDVVTGMPKAVSRDCFWTMKCCEATLAGGKVKQWRCWRLQSLQSRPKASKMFSLFAIGQETQAQNDAAEASCFETWCCSVNRRNHARTWSMACQVVEMQPPIHADEAAEAFEEECPTDDDTLPEAFCTAEQLHCIAQFVMLPKNAGGESPGLELPRMWTIALSARHACATQFDIQCQHCVVVCRNVVLVCRSMTCFSAFFCQAFSEALLS